MRAWLFFFFLGFRLGKLRHYGCDGAIAQGIAGPSRECADTHPAIGKSMAD
jgi:hypothetical protein